MGKEGKVKVTKRQSRKWGSKRIREEKLPRLTRASDRE